LRRLHRAFGPDFRPFSTLDTPAVHSHLMLSAMKNISRFVALNDPEKSATCGHSPGISLHLVAVAQTGGLRARGHNKRIRP
jgi:hypothetical protein